MYVFPPVSTPYGRNFGREGGGGLVGRVLAREGRGDKGGRRGAGGMSEVDFVR